MKNTVLASLILVAPVAAQAPAINQQPTGTFSMWSSVADSASNTDDFVVSAAGGVNINKICWWGAHQGGIVPNTESFDVIIHTNQVGTFPNPTNSAGAIHTQYSAVATTRTATGNQLATSGGSMPEYVYEFDLPSTLNLAAGHYHVEIYNVSTNWAWATGTLDPINGVAGFNWSGTAPGVSWNNSLVPGNGLAVRIDTGTVAPAISLNLFGTCGQSGSGLTGVGYTPNGPVGIGYSATQGAFVLPTSPCAGITIDIVNPTLYGVINADGGGDILVAPANGIPAGACGLVHVQAVDLATCGVSALLSL